MTSWIKSGARNRPRLRPGPRVAETARASYTPQSNKRRPRADVAPRDSQRAQNPIHPEVPLMKQRLLLSAALTASIFLQLVPQIALAQRRRAAAAAPTAAAGFDRARYQIAHKQFVLDNGLTLLVHEDHAVPVVGVNLWYHVGSRNEQRGKTGFAHLFEHFFFNGSEHHPHGFREAMDDLGAANRNGTTDTDRTNFFEDVPVSGLERTLYLEADRLGFLAAQINQSMLERERGVVQNEKRQGDNQPYGRVYDRLVEKMYPAAHPYSWSTIGSMDDLNAATVQDVQD